MSYTYTSTRYRTYSGAGGDPFDRFSTRYSSGRRYGYGGGSSYSSRHLGGSYRPSTRPRYTPGRHKPDYDSTYWKYRHYAEDELTEDKDEGKNVIVLDFHKAENKKAHHTDKYGVRSLVVRRGQQFKLTVELKVKFDKTTDQLQFIFSKGERPQESKGTLVRVNICKDKQTAENNPIQGWQGYISSLNGSSEGSVIGVIVTPPADALVGKYSVKTKVFDSDEDNKEKKRHVKDEDEMLYVLFNAWCKDDQVYMDKQSDRDEYVMNETGRIWVGSARNNNGRPWNFGQFSKHCLEAALYLLDLSENLKTQGHGNPTLVCRTLSAMANSNDDNGVLEGNWSGTYHGGTSPTAWNGSQSILEQYMLTKRRVRYGQCWVFSGVLTTLGRTLGIPTRSVTNFESAHDHDYSMTIDNHYNTECCPITKMDDSVWNFHVWNESWFARPDLPDGYDGWQAYDATPQEASEGIMRCGPAPVKAIKLGNVYLGYDTKFVFAEVNGDRVDWVVSAVGGMYPSTVDPHSVGKCISSKKPGSNLRDDLTHDYKYPEGSKEEREAVAKASKYSSRSDRLAAVYSEQTKDIVFTYTSDVKPNGDVTVVINTENTTTTPRNIVLRITATAAYYTGIPGEELCHEVINISLAGSEKQEKTWSLRAASYLNLIDEDAKVKLYLMAKVKETKQVFTKSEVFTIEKPELQLKLDSNSCNVGQRFDVSITVTNPVDVPLTEGVIRLEGPGIQKNMKIPIHQSVKPGQQYTEKVTLTPKYAGNREIIASFNSRQLSDITGAYEVQISFPLELSSGSGPSSRTSYRPRFRPGRTRPDYDNLWFKYRKYLSGYNQQDITTDGTKIINVDFLKTENRTAHLTDEYVNTSLIVRRGQEFKLNIDVEVPFYKAQDTLQLFLSKGSAPQQSKGTLVRLDIYTDKKTAEQKQTSTPKWYGYLSSVTDKNIGAILSVVIKPPCNALAGKYDITTKVLAADLSGQRKRFVKEEQKEAVYVLFNAWCKDDQVYLKDEAERQEYVLNQTGKIWVGSSNYNVGRKWNFGQFEEYCLETAVYLLDKCQEITAQAHGNVTLVARALSAMANSNDNDGGILTGNWSGNYNGGTSPTAWVGSQAILEEYMVTKRNVRYGQCWVFSGLLTTLGRTLGIPTRSITNFESAHDNDNSLTIDSFVTANGDPINGIGDSVWNFHVWNESWFKRPDLPDGYDGWQAYDATPQEASEGIMRCGPVPVLAVKQGNVFYKYDGRFVFGEVNGDKVTWEINFETGDETPVSIDEKAVGKKISTKQVGSDERHDVTNNYKYEEGSSEERQAVARAAQYSSRDIVDFKYLDLQTSDVTFVYNDNTKPNGDVTITLEMTNTSSEIRHVTLSLTAVAAYYTGINAEELDKKKVEVILDPGQGTKSFTYIIVAKTDEWTILAVNYFKVIDADAKLKIYIMAKAAETKQVYTKIEMLELEKPDLNLLISKPKVAIGETFDLTINFTNPLDMTLTQGYIMLEGPGIQKNKKIYIHRSVPANGELSERVQLTPKYKGKKEIIASFNCKELSGIYGSVKMEVN